MSRAVAADPTKGRVARQLFFGCFLGVFLGKEMVFPVDQPMTIGAA
jgi:hypothetical protein